MMAEVIDQIAGPFRHATVQPSNIKRPFENFDVARLEQRERSLEKVVLEHESQAKTRTRKLHVCGGGSTNDLPNPEP